jgi:hypothetical protein
VLLGVGLPEKGERLERREEREDLFYAYNIEWESTVFPYALGNTVETQ